MKIPVVSAVIDRRILVNYRIDPGALAAQLPAPFRPKLHRGFGIGGICLIRLRSVRPRFLPAWMGVTSENAAHRVAVEWDDGGEVREGVYVRRRDSDSYFNAIAGGRLFPGRHARAKFVVEETGRHFDVALRSVDGETEVSVVGDVADELPTTSIFESVEAVSAFFEGGSLGYSATPDEGRFEGLELRCRNWHVEPLRVTSVRSSCFDDRVAFPACAIAFDNALLMREIEHEWHGRSDLCCADATAIA